MRLSRSAVKRQKRIVMTAEKCFKPLYGKCTRTDETLYKDDCGLPVSPKDRAKLCQELGEDHYTYLVLSDGFCHEIIKVAQMHGHLYIERAQEHTSKEEWPCGTQLKFDWTRSGIAELKESEEVQEAECEELFTGKIKNGNCTVEFKDGVAIKETPNKNQIGDGCYDNPVITMEDGCIERIAEGSKAYRQTVCTCGGNPNRYCEKCG